MSNEIEQNRKAGFYRVRFHDGDWIVAQWFYNYWLLPGTVNKRLDEYFLEIDETEVVTPTTIQPSPPMRQDDVKAINEPKIFGCEAFYQTQSGALISDIDYQFLSDEQKSQCKLYELDVKPEVERSTRTYIDWGIPVAQEIPYRFRMTEKEYYPDAKMVKANEVIGMRWRSCDSLPEQLNILHFRLIDNAMPIAYKNVTISESHGNKWLSFWDGHRDVKSYTFPEVQWLDETESREVNVEEINKNFDKLVGENYQLSEDNETLKKALQGLVNDVKSKPNDTRYATHLKIANEAIEKCSTR